jgi:hypothetical protein
VCISVYQGTRCGRRAARPNALWFGRGGSFWRVTSLFASAQGPPRSSDPLAHRSSNPLFLPPHVACVPSHRTRLPRVEGFRVEGIRIWGLGYRAWVEYCVCVWRMMRMWRVSDSARACVPSLLTPRVRGLVFREHLFLVLAHEHPVLGGVPICVCVWLCVCVC